MEKKKWLTLSTGFALFSMFFGSGNLVFPILVGKNGGEHYLLSFLGIFLTGVVVPFLGSLGVMLYGGKLDGFFRSFGKGGVFLFSLIALSLLGPFGVVPRCLTVSHGALETLFPGISLPFVSLAFFTLIFFLAKKKRGIISILGAILTPMLLLAILAISFFGVKEASLGSLPLLAHDVSAWGAFSGGFVQGYQMMDLLAAFFFSAFVIGHIEAVKASSKVHRSSLEVFFRASLLGGGILSSVYFALVFLGSTYSFVLEGLVPQQMLGKIAEKTLGVYGAPCLCTAVVLACMTTAIILSTLFAEFFREKVVRKKISSSMSLGLTLVTSFVISTRGFTGIAAILGPIVEIIYPALIVLTLVNIAHKLLGTKNSHWPVTLTLVIKAGLLRLV